jgi:hypothetical protein
MGSLILFITTLIHLFAHPLGEPLMATSIVKNLNVNAPAHKCHQIAPMSKTILDGRVVNKVVNTDYFEATVECEFQCPKKKTQIKNVKQKFEPLKLGLFEGDGTSNDKILWRSLGTTLEVWSKQICLKEAKASCRDIEDFKVKKISSGNWSVSGSYSCQRKDTIYSPFDEQFQLEHVGAPNYFDFRKHDLNFSGISKNEVPSSLSQFLPESLKSQEAQKYVLEENAGDCKKRANVYTCFGDCVFQKDKKSPWNETLATNEYYGDYKVDVCLDEFAHLFHKKISNAESDLLCHQLIWEIFRRSNAMGTSCAAFRYDYQCPRF